MFRFFAEYKTPMPVTKEDFINLLDTAMININDQIPNVSSEIRRDNLLFLLSKYSWNDPYNLYGIKNYLEGQIADLDKEAKFYGKIACLTPLATAASLPFLTIGLQDSEDLERAIARRQILLAGGAIGAISTEVYAIYFYLANRYDAHQLKSILQIINDHLDNSNKLSSLLDERNPHEFAFRKKLNHFIKEKNEDEAMAERAVQQSWMQYIEWNPQESLFIPSRIGYHQK